MAQPPPAVQLGSHEGVIRMLAAGKANRRYFREAYRTGQHGWGVEEPDRYAVSFLKQLRKLVPSGSLLDVGCGEGRHAFAAARLSFKVTAVDYEPLALRSARAFARRSGAKDVLFRKANVLRLPFPASRFDVVLDYGCLHHQRKSDLAAYLAGITRVLKPQGFYMLSVFSPDFRLFKGSRRRWHIAFGAYRRCFTAAELRRLFRRHFEIISLRHEPEGFWHVLMKRHPDGS